MIKPALADGAVNHSQQQDSGKDARNPEKPLDGVKERLDLLARLRGVDGVVFLELADPIFKFFKMSLIAHGFQFCGVMVTVTVLVPIRVFSSCCR